VYTNPLSSRRSIITTTIIIHQQRPKLPPSKPDSHTHTSNNKQPNHQTPRSTMSGRPVKILSLRELQMAKRMLKGKKAPACQRELNALLAAMDRKDKGDANVNLRILQTALEHCLHHTVGLCVRVVFVLCLHGVGWVGWRRGREVDICDFLLLVQRDVKVMRHPPPGMTYNTLHVMHIHLSKLTLLMFYVSFSYHNNKTHTGARKEIGHACGEYGSAGKSDEEKIM
jgi:hypothetical protein